MKPSWKRKQEADNTGHTWKEPQAGTFWIGGWYVGGVVLALVDEEERVFFFVDLVVPRPSTTMGGGGRGAGVSSRRPRSSLAL